MKKIFLTLIIIALIFSINDSKTIYTFSSSDDYKALCIDVQNENITTRNFNNYFNQDVIGIVASINPIYESEFDGIYYKFNNVSYEENLRKYENIIINKLKEKGYKNDAYKIIYDGIKLKYIYVYSNNINYKKTCM